MSSYFFNGQFEDSKEMIGLWVAEKLKVIQNEEPESLFLEYIIIMIGNRKQMQGMGMSMNTVWNSNKH